MDHGKKKDSPNPLIAIQKHLKNISSLNPNFGHLSHLTQHEKKTKKISIDKTFSVETCHHFIAFVKEIQLCHISN